MPEITERQYTEKIHQQAEHIARLNRNIDRLQRRLGAVQQSDEVLDSLPISDELIPPLKDKHYDVLGRQKRLPPIFMITPTYPRWTQKADLTRLSQTLMHVPNLRWIVVEDAEEKTELVKNLLKRRKDVLKSTHLNIRTKESRRLVVCFHCWAEMKLASTFLSGWMGWMGHFSWMKQNWVPLFPAICWNLVSTFPSTLLDETQLGSTFPSSLLGGMELGSAFPLGEMEPSSTFPTVCWQNVELCFQLSARTWCPNCVHVYIRESVDSLCRDGVDTPMPPYIGKAFTRTNFEDLSLFRYIIMVCE